MKKNYTPTEHFSYMVASYEEIFPKWTAKMTFDFLKANEIDPYESYCVRCSSTSMKAGKALAAARMNE
tara:strand:- start:82 stop:285 length:204 start_codon:yes stop_codon:yes gene_type:complete